MKDVVSRLTFGFLMAQLFPGAVAVLAVTLAYFAYQRDLPDSVLAGIAEILKTWNSASVAQQLFLLGLCVGLGMLIHGVHWTVLGSIERDGKVSIFNVKWHAAPFALQVLFAPFRLVFEVIALLFVRGGIKTMGIDENVPRVHDKLMKQHEFLQEFYLYPAQFFAHTAYALLGVEMSLGVFLYSYGVTPRRIILAAIIYLGMSAFFTLARCQLVTLFRGEGELVRRSMWVALGNGSGATD